MGILKDLYEIIRDDVIPIIKEKKYKKRTSWADYKILFDVDGYQVPYITLIKDWGARSNVCEKPSFNITLCEEDFDLPEHFKESPYDPVTDNGECCRLKSFDIFSNNKLSLTLQKTMYVDYLKSGDYLDDPFPADTTLTNRDAFGKIISKKSGELWPFEMLTNICGTGIYIITSDNYIVVRKHSDSSHVYPGRLTFTSGGVMSWGVNPDPFEEVTSKCFKKTGHIINRDNLRFLDFGADARKLYFQFSFVERVEHNLSEFLEKTNSKSAKLFGIELSLDSITQNLVDNCWEPAAEVALLNILCHKFTNEKVYHALFSRKSLWDRRAMRDEWDYRASRPGEISVMSVRYPKKKLVDISKKYVDEVLDFMGDSIVNKAVLEIGSGIGRLTEYLVEEAKTVTCVELSERMIERSKRRLGINASKVNYVQTFGQDYYPERNYDVSICSLVLIHNVNNSDFEALIKRMCSISSTIFVFEDVALNRPTSPNTKLRDESLLKESFKQYNFELKNNNSYCMSEEIDDKIMFLEFSKSAVNG